MRYKAKFDNGTIYSLFGEDYFTDKAVFWRAHQSNLIEFSVLVCKLGHPIEINDSIANTVIYFTNKQAFETWFGQNQSKEIDFGFSDLKERETIVFECLNRLEQIEQVLNEEIQVLNSEPLNPWRFDGGYKPLEKLSQLGICSINKIKSNYPMLMCDDLFLLMEDSFATPNKIQIQGETILSHCKNQHDKLDKEKLIVFCQLNRERIGKIRLKIKDKNEQQQGT